MPQRNKVYEGKYPHFITSTVTHWLPVFCRDDYFRVLVDNIIHCIGFKGLLVHAYVLMPNHFHMICSQSEGKFSEFVRDFKGYTSRQLATKLEEDGRILWLKAMRKVSEEHTTTKIWQDDFYPEQVHSQKFFEQKLRYMHDNPVRAGYVEDPCDWKYSSAGFYYKEITHPIPITPIDW